MIYSETQASQVLEWLFLNYVLREDQPYTLFLNLNYVLREDQPYTLFLNLNWNSRLWNYVKQLLMDFDWLNPWRFVELIYLYYWISIVWKLVWWQTATVLYVTHLFWFGLTDPYMIRSSVLGWFYNCWYFQLDLSSYWVSQLTHFWETGLFFLFRTDCGRGELASPRCNFCIALIMHVVNHQFDMLYYIYVGSLR